MKKYLIGLIAASWGASSALAAQPAGNYNAAFDAAPPAGQFAPFSAASTGEKRVGSFVLPAKSQPSFKGYPSHYDAQLDTPTFLWADAGLKPALAAPIKGSKISESAARDYLIRQGDSLKLSKGTVDDAKLINMHDTGKGPVIARFQQTKDGIEVFGQQLNVMMDRNLKLVATSGYFAPQDNSTSAAPAAFSKKAVASARALPVVDGFVLPPERAVALAFADFTGQKLAPISVLALRTAGDYTVFSASARSGEIRPEGEQRTKKVYYYIDGKYVPAYYVEVGGRTIDLADSFGYGYVISATDGRVLFRKDQIEYNAVGGVHAYRAYADASGINQPFDSPLGNDLDPYVGTAPNGTLPRIPATTNLVTLDHGPISTNDPWLTSGATETTGNNVEAYLDLFGSVNPTTGVVSNDGFQPGTTDQRGAASSFNTFDYPYTPDADPSTASQRNFAIVNQFYVDNWLHDWWYDNGFDEASGNAQDDNYGRGGIGGDHLLAEGQDFSGRNNANERTPADGASPRQQMYLFDARNGEVTVDTAGSFGFNTAGFGAQTFDVTGPLVATGTASTTNDGCNPYAAGSLTGAIALTLRGTCGFTVKVKNAQNAGAIGVILANNAANGGPRAPGLGGTDATITIGTLSVSLADGITIRNALAATPGINARIRRAPGVDLDGTLDIQVIAHEWFHSTSNRLVGNASGLSNQQGRGMGEGWSDFSSMMLTVRPEDRGVTGNDQYQGAYPLAFYVTTDAYFGIRRAPYSTSFTTFPLTFRHISDGVVLPTIAPLNAGGVNSEVHNTGEIWCNTLWEIYASLLNDPRYSFTQAQERMKSYVIAGLKMTPNAPTMLEARDGLLAAARATDAQDFSLMATAFAKRGMGAGAVAPARTSTTNANAIEDFTAFAGRFSVTNASLDFSYVNGAVGYIDNDGVLDPGETALLSLTIVNNGTADITSPVVANLTSNGDTTFGNGGQITFPASSGTPIVIGGAASGTITVRLNSATQTAQSLTLTIAFPQVGATANEVFEAPSQNIGLIVNYDIQPNARANDNFDQPITSVRDWGVQQIGTGVAWTLRSASGFIGTTGTGWFATDNAGATDERLTTPVLQTTTGFSLAFDHYFAFEPAGGNVGFDGGIIEISTDNGATWTDAVAAGGTFTSGAGYNGTILALNPAGQLTPDDNANGHPGFVNNNGPTNVRTPLHVVLSLPDSFAGQSVRLRFREATDTGGAVFGWWVDNVSFTGISNLPFSAIVAENGVPDNQTPVANAGVDQNVLLGSGAVTLDGSGSTDDVGVTGYAWTQLSGPTASLGGANTATPSFTPTVTGTYVFQLTVQDVRTASASDTVSVLVYSRPQAFSYGAVNNVAPGATVTTGGRTISGITSTAPISVVAGSIPVAYSVGGGPFTTAPGTVEPGASVRLQVTAQGTFGTSAPASINVGGAIGTLTVNTQAQDTTPDSFTFAGAGNVQVSTVQTSASIYVAGINAPAPISIGGDASALYSIAGGAFTNSPGTVSRSQAVRVRVTSAATRGTASTATLTIGGVSGSYTVTTSAAEDITPNPVSWNAVGNVRPGTVFTTGTRTIAGIDAPATVSIAGDPSALFSVNGDAFSNASRPVLNGQTVALRLTAAAANATTVSATVTIGTYSTTWNLTTRP